MKTVTDEDVRQLQELLDNRRAKKIPAELALRTLLDKRDHVRRLAASVICQERHRVNTRECPAEAWSQCIPLLADEDRDIRFAAAKCLSIHRVPSAAGPLLDALERNGDDVDFTEMCTSSLHGLEFAVFPYRQRLINLLRSPVLALRRAAHQFIFWSHPLPDDERLLLTEAMQDEDPEVRFRAAERLLERDVITKEALAIAAEAVRHQRPWAGQALTSLTSGGKQSQEHVPLLLDTLLNNRTNLRWEAAYALETLAPDDPETTATLCAILDAHSDLELCEAVCRILRAARPASSVPHLVALLERPTRMRETVDETTGVAVQDDPLRYSAILALGGMGPMAAPAVDAICKCAATPVVNDAIAQALGQIGVTSPRVIQTLETILDSATEHDALEVIAALQCLRISNETTLRAALAAAAKFDEATSAQAHGSGARSLFDGPLLSLVAAVPESIPVLVALAGETDRAMAERAARVLLMAGHPTQSILEETVAELNSPDAALRHQAVASLRRMGSRAHSIFPTLLELARHGSAGTRTAALKTVGVVSTRSTVEQLLALLQEALADNDVSVRKAAVIALADLPDPMPQELRGRIQTYQDDPDEDVRWAALSCLQHQTDRTMDIAEAMVRFAGSLLRAVDARKHGNLVFSPFSLWRCLAILGEGAQGRTRAEIAVALHGTERCQADLPVILDKLRISQDQHHLTLTSSVALWCQRNVALRKLFLEQLHGAFAADVKNVDFAKTHDVMKEMNAWISEKTCGRIGNVVDQVPPETLLALTDAVYFKGRWEVPFNKGTREAPFHDLDGQVSMMPMMHTDLECLLARGPGWQCVELPYKGGRTSMVVLIPDAGCFHRVQALAMGPALATMLSSMERTFISLLLPRFEIDSDLDLTQVLPKAGITTLFTEERDVTGMMERGPQGDFRMEHVANIRVNEEGTEAAAVTVALHIGGGPDVVVCVDRPFLFIVREQTSGVPVFMGRVVQGPRS